MKIEIFTEDSGTTADCSSVDRVEDFFRGRFLSVRGLANKLSSYGQVSIHIISDDYGYLQGSDSTSDMTSKGNTDAIQDFSEAIYKHTQTADVVVILLTKSMFEETVAKQWDELPSITKSDSIWCIGASQGAISSVDIDKMRSSDRTVLLYDRVGVARLSNDVKEELTQAVDQASK